MSKKLLGWAILTAWILAWCSDSNNKVNEGNETVKDSITVINDSVNKMLKEVVNQNTHDRMCGNRNIKWRKIPLLESEAVEEKVKRDTVKSRADDLMRMYEAWIDDWDEMKEYVQKNHEQSDYIWAFIMSDIEWEGSDEVDEYDDTDEEIGDDVIFTGKTK